MEIGSELIQSAIPTTSSAGPDLVWLFTAPPERTVADPDGAGVVAEAVSAEPHATAATAAIEAAAATSRRDVNTGTWIIGLGGVSRLNLAHTD